MKSAILAVGLALITAACGNKKSKAAEAPPDIDGLDALGIGVRVVVGGDVELLEASRLVRRGVKAMLSRDAELKTRISSLIDDCRLEPGENIGSFIIGLGEGPTDVILVVTGTFEENALTACVQKRLTDSGGRLATKAYAGRTIYRAEGASGSAPVWFALGSPRTLIVSASEPWLQKGLGDGPRLLTDGEMKKLLAEAPTESAVWATGFVPVLAAQQLASSTNGAVAGPKTMTAKLDFKAGIQAVLSAQMASEKDANALKGLFKLQKPAVVAMAQAKGLGQLANLLEVDGTGKQLDVKLIADEATLSKLLSTVDSGATDAQNPPSPDPEGKGDKGDKENGQGNAPSNGKAPVR